MHQEKKYPFENIVEKGDNAGNQYFLLFPQYFQRYQRRIHFLVTMKLSSANAFNLGKANTLSSGKGLTLSQTINLDSSKLKEFAGDNFQIL